MFVGRIKKDVTKALNELIEEGVISELVSVIVKQLVENTSVTYDAKSKSVTIKFKREF